MRRWAIGLIAMAATFGVAASGAAAHAGSTLPRCARTVGLVGPAPTDEGTSAVQPPENRPFTFTVTSSGCALPGSVAYTTFVLMADETDFDPVAGVLTFAGGDLAARSITVNVFQDATPEQNEAFLVVLCDATGYVTVANGLGSATATILNDDGETIPGAVVGEAHCSR